MSGKHRTRSKKTLAFVLLKILRYVILDRGTKCSWSGLQIREMRCNRLEVIFNQYGYTEFNNLIGMQLMMLIIPCIHTNYFFYLPQVT